MCLKLKGTLSDIVLEGGQASRLSEAFSRIRVKRVTDDVTLHPQKCPFRRRICIYEYGKASPARDHNVTSLHIKF